MSPDEILAALAAPEGFPREAMTAAGDRREEVGFEPTVRFEAD